MGMHGCDIVFTPEVAEKVKATLNERWGQCPCDARRCPLLPDALDDLMPCRTEVA
jgi:hypothetical protein